MNARSNTRRAAYRGALHLILWTSIVIEVVTFLAHDHLGNEAGWTLFLCASVLLLWSHHAENAEQIRELQRREQFRLDTDRAATSRMVELMDSAWRNDPVYREQRQKREAQEKYLRDLTEQLDAKKDEAA